jgi:HlyD family secretion protein
MRNRVLLAAVLMTATGLSANALYSRRAADAPAIITDAVSRGSIVSQVSASGTLEAVTTVQVGSQISGTVQALYADFNSIVKRGQVIARLDPSLLQAAIEQARASVIRAEADIDRLTVALTDAQTKERRARELSQRGLIPQSDFETAEVTRLSAEAQVRSARAQATQAKAALSQAQVNLEKTVIASPIDGIVIARNVDVGQTVAASLQAPTIFVIAADLSQMQVRASIDESDLGQIEDGQPVTFTVDAYPQDTFTGAVRQVRLNPVVEQNVVTYAAIISAPNLELKLRPGMTASVTVEVARRDDVLRVPNAALRFEPGNDVLAALGQSVNEEQETPPVRTSSQGVANQQARTNVSTVWLHDDRLQEIPVRVGITDGTLTEVVGGAIREGSRVATRVVAADKGTAASGSSRPSSGSGNPLFGSTQRRF